MTFAVVDLVTTVFDTEVLVGELRMWYLDSIRSFFYILVCFANN